MAEKDVSVGDEEERRAGLDYFVNRGVVVYRVTLQQLEAKEEPAVGNCCVCGKPGKAWTLHRECHKAEDGARVGELSGVKYYDKCRAVFYPRRVKGDQFAFLIPKFVAKMYGHSNEVAETIIEGDPCMLMRAAPLWLFANDTQAFKNDGPKEALAWKINFMESPFSWRKVDFALAQKIQEE